MVIGRMVLVSADDNPRATREFVASVVILHHSTTIGTGKHGYATGHVLKPFLQRDDP